MSLQSDFFLPVGGGRVARRSHGRIATAGVLALVLLVVQTGFGHSVLRAAGLSRPTASFVELYFPDAKALPSMLPASGRLSIRFAVDNVGLATRSFVWQVSDETSKAHIRLASGRSIVTGNRTVVVARTVRADCSGERTELLVSLQRSSARITLWLACPNAR
jgi:hypothetical protein